MTTYAAPRADSLHLPHGLQRLYTHAMNHLADIHLNSVVKQRRDAFVVDMPYCGGINRHRLSSLMAKNDRPAGVGGEQINRRDGAQEKKNA